jgi:hypothetical protein
LVDVAARSDGWFDFVRAGIGQTLRALLADILIAAIPQGMAELLRQLDQPAPDDVGP